VDCRGKVAISDDNTYMAAFWNTSNTTRAVGVHVVCGQRR
jgi:hypothetical protein